MPNLTNSLDLGAAMIPLADLSSSTPVELGLVITVIGSLMGFAFWTGRNSVRLTSLESLSERVVDLLAQGEKRIQNTEVEIQLLRQQIKTRSHP